MTLRITFINRWICSCDDVGAHSETALGRRLPPALDHEPTNKSYSGDHLRPCATRSTECGTSTICGFDFDGVLRKLPYPFKVYMKRISASDPISRAGLAWVKGIMNSLIERTPAVIDPKVHDIMSAVGQGGKTYIVSGRSARGCHRIGRFLKRYGVTVDGVLCRENAMLTEAEFKLECCRKLRLTVFFEDRPPVAQKLARSGINVVLWR